MRVTTTAAAGTLESSDVLITVEPGEKAGIEIELEGATAVRFGDQIRSVVRETLSEFGIDSCRVRLQDKGALDCTIRARLSADPRFREVPPMERSSDEQTEFEHIFRSQNLPIGQCAFQTLQAEEKVLLPLSIDPETEPRGEKVAPGLFDSEEAGENG